MTYADEDKLNTMIHDLEDSVSDDLSALSIEMSDAWINSSISPISGTIPNLVVMAATYKAYAFILRILYSTEVNDSEITQFWDKQADDVLQAYSDTLGGDSVNPSPYSHSQTPTRKEQNKNVRTTYDYTNYDNVNDTEWTSE